MGKILTGAVTLLGAGDAATVVDWSAVAPVMEALSTQINVVGLVGVIAGALAASVGLVFTWFAVRKGIIALMAALRNGRVSA